VCLKSGRDIKTKHDDCRKCDHHLITTCAGFRTNNPVALTEFYDWFMKYRGMKPKELDNCSNTQGELQSLEEKE
jgi:hypothetical protein